MKIIPIALLILCLCGCLNKIAAVKEYQVDATKHCLEHHSAEACKPLPYPSTEPSDERGR